MYYIAENKGISDPEVLEISCLLDKEILSLQKKFNDPSKEVPFLKRVKGHSLTVGRVIH
ncbi:aspartyl-phosphate phosphatase Spo0E family protein [Peribacillus butanolivorans]|uniref:aspartyl-phosphate phosphatase Spo0E family protein n=1 Tax=Peribacillus butanolivorans TaxID=421767 RepID=UPI0039FC8186